MISNDPTVSGNLKHLQRQITKLATAPMGPVSIGPGEGHIRMYTGTGDTFELLPEGARVKFRGAMTGLSPLMEQHRTTLEAHTGRLDGHDGTIASHGTRLDTLHSRANGQDSLNATQNGEIGQLRADLTYQTARVDNRATTGQLDATNGRVDTLHSRANGVDSLNATQNGQIAQLGVDVSTAQSRADSAYTRAGTGISDAATAQARADSAYARAGTAIVDAANADSRAQSAQSNAAKIAAWIRDAVNQDPSGLPPWGGL